MNTRIRAVIGGFSSETGVRIDLLKGDVASGAISLSGNGTEEEQRVLAQQLIKAVNSGVQFESKADTELDKLIEKDLGRSPEEQQAHERICPVCSFNRAVRSFMSEYEAHTGKKPNTDFWVDALMNIVVAYVLNDACKGKDPTLEQEYIAAGWLHLNLSTIIAEHMENLQTHETVRDFLNTILERAKAKGVKH